MGTAGVQVGVGEGGTLGGGLMVQDEVEVVLEGVYFFVAGCVYVGVEDV